MVFVVTMIVGIIYISSWVFPMLSPRGIVFRD